MYRSLIDRLERSSSFGGAVSHPGVPLLELPVPEMPNITVQTVPTQPARPENSQTLSGLVLGRLTNLHPTSDELKARLSDMISEAASLMADADAIVEECHAEQRSLLEQRHEEIRAQGRKQQALIKKLEKEFAQANQFWNMAKESKGERQADLEQRLAEQRGLDQWASDREILDAKIRVKDAQAAYKAAIEKDSEAMQQYSQANSALSSATATLAEWSKTEAQVRAELEGVPHYDAVLGLEVR